MNEAVKHKLCRLHQRSYCHLVGSGTAGIALSLEALGLKGRLVAIPDSVCINVPLAVFYSGNYPAYLDINLDDFGLLQEDLERQMKSLDAVVAVHGYGSVCRIGEIESIAAKHGVPIIEDACLVQGGHVGDRPAGSFGIASVVSFGAGKPVSIGHGGAILTDDVELYRSVKALDAELMPFAAETGRKIDDLSKEYKKLYNAHYGHGFSAHVEPFRQRALTAQGYFLHRFDDRMLARLEVALEALPGKIALRWKTWEKLSKGLKEGNLGTQVHVLVPPQGSVPWRFNLLMDRRNLVMSTLHRLGLPASSWHPPVSSVFSASNESRGNSILIGERILNLWVTDDVDDNYIDAAVQAIGQVLA